MLLSCCLNKNLLFGLSNLFSLFADDTSRAIAKSTSSAVGESRAVGESTTSKAIGKSKMKAFVESTSCAAESTSKSVAESTSRCVTEPIFKSVATSISTAVAESISTAVAESISTAVAQSTSKSAVESTSKSVAESVSITVDESTSISNDESTRNSYFEYVGRAGSLEKGKSVKRPCVFCGMFQSKLKRHMVRRHKNEESVQAAMLLPMCEQAKAFENLRKEGIFQTNVRIQAGGGTNESLLRERKQGASKRVLCSGCKGFYSKKQIHRHKKHCSHTSSMTSNSVDFSGSRPTGVSKQFQEQVLDKFRDDDCGKICRKDKLVILLGQRLWMKSRKKERKVIMSDMRILGNLILAVNRLSDSNLSGEDLLHREHYDHLVKAIEDLTVKEHTMGQKSGLKLSIGYVLKKAIKIMKGHYIQFNMLEEAEEVVRFSDRLNFDWTFLFSSAQLECEERRGVLRKPESLPLEEDVQKLKEYAVTEMHDLIKDEYKIWDLHDFVALRNLIVCRLTMFNARRGGEPARMTVNEWREAEENQWVDPNRVQQISDPMEKALLSSTRLAYMSGKGGKRLVPVLIPHDTVEPLRKLQMERENANIHKDNPFLFPNTGGSLDHAIGWNSLKSVTLAMGNQLKRPNLLIADKFRHRASTLYALLDVAEHEREPFFRHMGHSAEINRNVYQCPLAVTEITKVGGFLASIDGVRSLTQSKRGMCHSSLASQPETAHLPASNSEEDLCGLAPGHIENSDTHMVTDYSASNLEEAITDSLKTSEVSTGSSEADRSCAITDCNKMSVSQQKTDNSEANLQHVPFDYGESNLSPSTHGLELSQCNLSKDGSTTRQYNQWNPSDSQTVCSHFRSYIQTIQPGSRGSLPSVAEIKAFLAENPIFSQSALCNKQLVRLVRTKIFNERKKFRSKAKFTEF